MTALLTIFAVLATIAVGITLVDSALRFAGAWGRVANLTELNGTLAGRVMDEGTV